MDDSVRSINRSVKIEREINGLINDGAETTEKREQDEDCFGISIHIAGDFIHNDNRIIYNTPERSGLKDRKKSYTEIDRAGADSRKRHLMSLYMESIGIDSATDATDEQLQVLTGLAAGRY